MAQENLSAVGLELTLLGLLFAEVGRQGAQFRTLIALVGLLFALVGTLVALVGTLVAFVGTLVALVRVTVAGHGDKNARGAGPTTAGIASAIGVAS